MSTNHVKPDGETPSWLTDRAGTAWAAGPPPTSVRPGPEVRGQDEQPDPGGRPEPAPSASAYHSPDLSAASSSTPSPPPTVTSTKAELYSYSAGSPAPPSPPAGKPDGAPERPSFSAPAARSSSPEAPAPFVNAVRSTGSTPKLGWRAALYRATGWNPGLSAAEQRLIRQQQMIRTPIDGPQSVVVGSVKGGVGKTTVSALLGQMLAEHRGERVVAIDANPDAGTLGDRLVGEQKAAQLTVRKLLNNLDAIHSFSDLSRFVHLIDRLQVVTSEQEPEASEAFSHADYDAVVSAVARYCQVLVTDSGTGITHSAAQGGLARCDSIVIVGSPTQDAASKAANTLNWLNSKGHERLASNAVVVLSQDRSSPFIDEAPILDHFRARCRAVLTLPADPHLHAGGPIDLDALKPATRDAAMEIAATVAEAFYASPTSLGRTSSERSRAASW